LRPFQSLAGNYRCNRVGNPVVVDVRYVARLEVLPSPME
jgi:hypothetical protein